MGTGPILREEGLLDREGGSFGRKVANWGAWWFQGPGLRPMRTIENFERWNDEMSRKYNIDEYREKSHWFIQWVEGLRDRTILKYLDVKEQDRVVDLGCGAWHLLS